MYWKDITEIVEKLEDLYEQEEIPESLEELKEMVLSIDDFEGRADDEEVDTQTLRDILEYWIEVRNNKH
ncbi:MAG: Fe-S cluster assembly protein IscX [Rickettsiaceae bacterium]|nr:Fe-S cluster assembly protein IscX [Rickettsiaceae bacterium]